jgi:hypothetical protein
MSIPILWVINISLPGEFHVLVGKPLTNRFRFLVSLFIFFSQSEAHSFASICIVCRVAPSWEPRTSCSF